MEHGFASKSCTHSVIISSSKTYARTGERILSSPKGERARAKGFGASSIIDEASRLPGANQIKRSSYCHSYPLGKGLVGAHLLRCLLSLSLSHFRSPEVE